MLIPTTCPVCGVRGPAPCGPCRGLLRPARSLPRLPGVVRCSALLDYAGAGREVVARLKYRNARSSLPFLAAGMAALVDRTDVDVVTWVPTTAQRRRQRGFDQAQLLARSIAHRLHLPCRGLLVRHPGPPQTGQALADRRRGPSFSVRRRPPRRVLLVDDVVTTGATVSAAARALSGAGAHEIHVVAAARTLPPAARLDEGPSGLQSVMAVCGSVVESRCQPQAKRPT